MTKARTRTDQPLIFLRARSLLVLNPMKDLVLLSLHEYHVTQLDFSKDLTPEYLCRQRGIDTGLLLGGYSFVDETLGMRSSTVPC